MTERTKKGSKVAGSSRVADLVGGTPAFGFGAFGSTNSSNSLTTSMFSLTLLPEDTDYLDAESKVLLKRLSKKDAQTKIKATDDLKVYLAQTDDENLSKFVAIWPKIFNRAALDVERKIRENLIACHSILFTRLKKEMAPVLKQVIGTWLCLQFDNASAEVAKVATESFQKAFPNKKADVLAFCQSEVQSFVSDNIIYHTVETMSDPRYNTPEEMLAKYIRVVSGSFSIISCLYENIIKLDALNICFEQLLNNSKFWEMAKSPHAPIRRSVYDAIKTFALLDASVSPITDRLKLVKSNFLNECFSDKETMTHSSLWDAVWSVEDLTSKKGAASRLFKYLENGCYGSGTGSWPALLALVAHLPKEFFDVPSVFRERFFDSFWLGVTSVHVTPVNSNAFVKSLQECSLFLFLKYGDSVFASKETLFRKLAPPTLNLLFEALLIPSLNPDAQFKLSKEDLENAITGFITKVSSTSTVTSAYSESLVTSFVDEISFVFANGKQSDASKELLIDEFIVFCERSSGLIETFNRFDIKSTFLKEKLEGLSGALLLESIKRIAIQDSHLKAVIQMFIGLSKAHAKSDISKEIDYALQNLVNHSLASLLISESTSLSLIAPILKLIGLLKTDGQKLQQSLLQQIVGSGNLKAVGEYLNEVSNSNVSCVSSPELDQLVVDLVKRLESKDLIIQSLVDVDGARGVSSDAVDAISHIVSTAIEEFWNGSVSRVDGLVERKSLSLWKLVAPIVHVKNSDLLDLAIEKWRGLVLDAEFNALPSDFVLYYQRLCDLVSESAESLAALTDRILFGQATWGSLASSYKASRPQLAILDPSYVSNEISQSTSRTDIESSLFARVSSVLAGILVTSSKGSDEKLVYYNAFQLYIFKTLLAESRSAVGVQELSFIDPSKQIDTIVLEVLSQETDFDSWAVKAFPVVGEFGSAGSDVDGRVFAKMAGLAIENLSEAWKNGVLGLARSLFDAGNYHIAAPLCYEARKYFDSSAVDTFILSLSRAASIPKSELSNPTALRKTVAALSILTSILHSKDALNDSIASSLKNLAKQFRVWYMVGNSVRVSEISPELSGQASNYLLCLIERGVEFDIGVSGFIVELTKTMITDACSKVVLFRALGLYQALSARGWPALDRFADELQESCLEIIIEECSGKHLLVVSKPQVELQSRLAYICGQVEFSLLFKRLPLNELTRLLFTNNSEVQLMAYRLLSKLTLKLVEVLSIKLEMSVRSDDDEKRADKYIGEQLVEGISKNVVFMEPNHLIESKTYELRTNIISELKDLDFLPKLLEFLFFALGVGYAAKPFDLSGWEFTSIEIEGLDFESEIGISLLCSHIYYRVLRNTPALARSWWSSCKDRQLTLAVEAYTDRWFTPLLMQDEIDLVLTTGRSSIEDVELKASKQTGEITATYIMDEASADMVVRFPPAFPLKPVEFTSNSGGRTIGVPEARWRGWMLSANIIAQNTAIIDSLGLWQKNIKLHFEGKEECAICYSVVGVIDRTLPNKSCRTCKNKFHASCLFKWIRTSGNTQCPMCRSEL
ncbi:UNVERIFIED_CONTAM: hypothetical protein HDU68_011490 [Siphonaria sp. JEL0065]|nr:hypothetical protein HDU68_011490 [Siphonaria sp. JEL0065]